MLAEERRTEFHQAVAAHKIAADTAKSDKPLLITGVLLMLAGVVGTFVEYQASLSRTDLRDISSSQILAVFFLVLAVAGAALYIAASIARMLRIWLLRQLVEGRDRTEELVAALRSAE